LEVSLDVLDRRAESLVERLLFRSAAGLCAPRRVRLTSVTPLGGIYFVRASARSFRYFASASSHHPRVEECGGAARGVGVEGCRGAEDYRTERARSTLAPYLLT